MFGKTPYAKRSIDRGIIYDDVFSDTADHFFAWGEIDKLHYVLLGVDPNKITVTGCGRFDRYYRDSTCRERFEDKHPKLNVIFCCLFLLGAIIVMAIPALIGWVTGTIGEWYENKNRDFVSR